MKKLFTIAIALLAGFSIATAQDEKPEGKKKPEAGEKGKGKGPKGNPMKMLDTDGDGSISKEEFAAGPMAKRMKESGKGDPDKVFAKMDADSDGKISGEEFKASMKDRAGKGDKKPKDGDKKPKGEKKPKAE